MHCTADEESNWWTQMQATQLCDVTHRDCDVTLRSIEVTAVGCFIVINHNNRKK